MPAARPSQLPPVPPAALTIAIALPASATTHASTTTSEQLAHDRQRRPSISLTIGSIRHGAGFFSPSRRSSARPDGRPGSRPARAGADRRWRARRRSAPRSIRWAAASRNNFWKLRDAGAIAHEMLVSAAMLGVGGHEPRQLASANGVIVRPERARSARTARWPGVAARLTPPTSAPLVPDAQFACIRQRPFARPTSRSKVDGSAVYGLDDVRVPGYALRGDPPLPVVRRDARRPCRQAAGRSASCRPGSSPEPAAAGALATSMRRRRRRPNTWTPRGAPEVKLDANRYRGAQQRAVPRRRQGAAASTVTPRRPGAANGPTLRSTQSDQHHAASIWTTSSSMPPTNPINRLHGSAELHRRLRARRAARSGPDAVGRACLEHAGRTDRPRRGQQITIHATYLGGGLGRKAGVDFISQAVQVRMALGKPVKLMWPREEDFTHDQYRPMALVRARAALGRQRRHRRLDVSATSRRRSWPSAARCSAPPAATRATGLAGAALPIRCRRPVRDHPSPVPVGFTLGGRDRSTPSPSRSAINELALAMAGPDHVNSGTRLTNPRWLAVLETAANGAGWGASQGHGTVRRIGIGTAFQQHRRGGRGVKPGRRRMTKSCVAAGNCRRSTGGDRSRHQIIGGVVHGLNAALYPCRQQQQRRGARRQPQYARSRLREMPTVRGGDHGAIPSSTGPSASAASAARRTHARRRSQRWPGSPGFARASRFIPNATMVSRFASKGRPLSGSRWRALRFKARRLPYGSVNCASHRTPTGLAVRRAMPSNRHA